MQAARRSLLNAAPVLARTLDGLAPAAATGIANSTFPTAGAAATIAGSQQLTSLGRWYYADGNGCMTLELPFDLEDMRLCAVPKKKVSPHRRGMRNANKFIRRVPLVSMCSECGRVMHPMSIPSNCKQDDCPAGPPKAAKATGAEDGGGSGGAAE